MTTQRFVDQMDTARKVEVLRQEGNQNVCKVYFQESENQTPTYVGITNIPTKLFGSDRWNDFIGFR